MERTELPMVWLVEGWPMVLPFEDIWRMLLPLRKLLEEAVAMFCLVMEMVMDFLMTLEIWMENCCHLMMKNNLNLEHFFPTSIEV